MEKITIKTDLDVSTGLETQLEFSSLNLGSVSMPGLNGNVNITISAKKQYLKKDGVTVHNEEFIQLGIKPDDSEEVKLLKESAITAFEVGIKTNLIELLIALK